MSNIALYSEEKLVNNTNFVNNFLDQIIEQYCEKRYTPGVAIQSFKVPSITEVILDYYPQYYFKAPGLLADKQSTNVMIVYEPHLHDTLQQSLEHKFSRLFIQANSSIGLLRLYKKDMNSSRFSSSNQRIFPLFDNSAELIEHLRRVTKYKFRFQDIESLAVRSLVALTTNQTELVLIYKPDVDYALKLQAYNKSLNEKLINDIWFFDLSYAQKEGFNQELAYTIHCKNSFCLSDYFTPEFCLRMESMAEEVMKSLQNKAEALAEQLRFTDKANEIAAQQKKLQQEQERQAQEQQYSMLYREDRELEEERRRRNTSPLPDRTVENKQAIPVITKELIEAHREHIHESNLKESVYTNKQALTIVIVLLIALFIVGILVLSNTSFLG